jgi:hypothetical protein
MPNQNGQVYGLTLLCPILTDGRANPSHDLAIRDYLSKLPTGAGSPFAIAPGTHMCRLVVMDDVVFVGAPAREEHLASKYLIFEANIDCASDSALDAYWSALAQKIPHHLNAVWSHCVGYPGTQNPAEFVRYMRACQLETTFFFAATNDKTREQTLKALQTQRAVADFIAAHQGMAAAELQRKFLAFAAHLQSLPAPLPAIVEVSREPKTGGRNE